MLPNIRYDLTEIGAVPAVSGSSAAGAPRDHIGKSLLIEDERGRRSRTGDLLLHIP